MNKDMNQETLERLRDLKLYGMYNTFKTSLDNYNKDNMTIDKFVSMLVTSEWDDRYNRSVERLIKTAAFKYPASVEELDYSTDRGLDRNLMERLADLSFIREKRNILITGSTGTGKTYIASALGYSACQKGMKVIYASTNRLLGQLKTSKSTGNIIKDLRKIQRAELLILDDFVLTPLDNTTRGILMEIVDDRYERCPTIFSSQIPVGQWYDAIGEQTIADAIMDRVCPGSVRIELYGESLRRRKSEK